MDYGSAIPALDDHALKLDTLKAGQAHLGGLTFEGLEFAEIVQKVNESADKINQANLRVGLMQQALDANVAARKAAVQANDQALKARLESHDSEIKQQLVIQQQRADEQAATLRCCCRRSRWRHRSSPTVRGTCRHGCRTRCSRRRHRYEIKPKVLSGKRTRSRVGKRSKLTGIDRKISLTAPLPSKWFSFFLLFIALRRTTMCDLSQMPTWQMDLSSGRCSRPRAPHLSCLLSLSTWPGQEN